MECRPKVGGFLCFAIFALMGAGCIHRPTIQYPPFADQAKTIEDPAKARVYLIRPDSATKNPGVDFFFYGIDPAATGPRFDPHQRYIFITPGRVHPMNPDANSRWRLIGQVGAGSYLCWEEAPHPLTMEKVSGDTNTTFTLDLAAGKTFYLRASIPGFFKPTPTLELLTEEEGQKLLKQCRPPNDYRKPGQK